MDAAQITEQIDTCTITASLHRETREESDSGKVYWEAVKKLNDIARSPFYESFMRSKALFKLHSVDPEMALERLWSLLDSLDLSDGAILENSVDVVRRIVKQYAFTSDQRFLCAVSCFNSDMIDCCFEFFSVLIQDVTMTIQDRVECAKYLFYTEVEDYVKLAQECMLSIVDDLTLPSLYRYESIAAFIGTTGIAAKYRTTLLAVYGSDEFVYPLQERFFLNDKNDTRERLLSGQHLLQLDLATEHWPVVEQILLNVASGQISPIGLVPPPCTRDNEKWLREAIHNTRADAADMIMRLGKSEQSRSQAAEIIGKLGTEDDKTAIGSNFYSNKQNVHLISETSTYIEKMVVQATGNVPKFNQVQDAITDLINSTDTLSYAQCIHAFKSLNRVSVDTARFTKYNMTQSLILCYVWHKIINHEHSSELKNRLVEELIDMADTCSSGHVTRFANIFSLYEDSGVTISLEQQLRANVGARMWTLIKAEPDERKALLSEGAYPSEEMTPERKSYIDFIDAHTEELRNELSREFVDMGFMSRHTFGDLFNGEIQRLKTV